MKIKIFIFLFLAFCANTSNAQLKKAFKFSTFYAAVNGGTSLADQDVFSVDGGILNTEVVETPYDYNLALGIRKIQRFQYEGTSPFKDGTESAYGDAASVGRAPFEYLFEVEYKRQEGIEYFDQQHFIRYVKPVWLAKAEFVRDGFADIEYYETTQRFRINSKSKLSFNIGAVQRIAEPYGYDPLEEWRLATGHVHYTCLAIEEGYNVDVYESEYKDPEGEVVATNPEVWNEVVIPNVLRDYVQEKRDALPNQWQHSLVVGFDFYHYKKNFWVHSWGNLIPYHLDTDGEYSYHRFVNSGQWLDYSGGLIFGKRFNKSFGVFAEGKFHKYWDRSWHDFSVGINYVII